MSANDIVDMLRKYLLCELTVDGNDLFCLYSETCPVDQDVLFDMKRGDVEIVRSLGYDVVGESSDNDSYWFTITQVKQ